MHRSVAELPICAMEVGKHITIAMTCIEHKNIRYMIYVQGIPRDVREGNTIPLGKHASP